MPKRPTSKDKGRIVHDDAANIKVDEDTDYYDSDSTSSEDEEKKKIFMIVIMH